MGVIPRLFELWGPKVEKGGENWGWRTSEGCHAQSSGGNDLPSRIWNKDTPPPVHSEWEVVRVRTQGAVGGRKLTPSQKTEKGQNLGTLAPQQGVMQGSQGLPKL